MDTCQHTDSSPTLHQYHGYMMWPSVRYDMGTTKLMRRSITGMDKQCLCNYDGCDKAFYDRKNLLRHQTLKHGRKPDMSHSKARFKF